MSDRYRILLRAVLAIALALLMGIVLLPIGFAFLILGLAGEADSIGHLPSIGIGLILWALIPFLAKIALNQLKTMREIQAQADPFDRVPPVAARCFVFGAVPLSLFTYACQLNDDFRGLEPFAFAGSLGASIACAYLWSRRV